MNDTTRVNQIFWLFELAGTFCWRFLIKNLIACHQQPSLGFMNFGERKLLQVEPNIKLPSLLFYA